MAIQRQFLDISVGTVLKIAAVIIALTLLYLTREILVILFLAVIIASAVSLLAGALERYRVPRLIGVLATYLVGVVFFSLVLYLIIPPIVDEIKQLAVVLPDYYEIAARQIFKTTSGISPDYAKNAQSILLNFGEKIKEFTSGIFNIASALFGSAVSFVAIIVISFYLSIQKKGVEDFLRLIIPQDQEEYVINVWMRVEKKLGKWLQGQIIIALIMGVTVFIGLTLIGVPYALLLGVVAGVLEIVPIAGRSAGYADLRAFGYHCRGIAGRFLQKESPVKKYLELPIKLLQSALRSPK